MYRPLPDCVTIDDSLIEGLGLFATKKIPQGTLIGKIHIWDTSEPDGYARTPLGAFGNHSDTPNCFKLKMYEDGSWWIGTKRVIEPGEELTWFYTLYNIKKEK